MLDRRQRRLQLRRDGSGLAPVLDIVVLGDEDVGISWHGDQSDDTYFFIVPTKTTPIHKSISRSCESIEE